MREKKLRVRSLMTSPLLSCYLSRSLSSIAFPSLCGFGLLSGTFLSWLLLIPLPFPVVVFTPFISKPKIETLVAIYVIGSSDPYIYSPFYVYSLRQFAYIFV